MTDRDSGDAATTARLNEQLLLARESIRSLTESLALANSEAEIFKRQAEDLQVKFDALAPGADGGGEIEERLLSTVNELTRQQKENALLLERLLALAEGVQIFLKTVETADNEEREAFEKEMQTKAANTSDPAAQAEAKALLDAMTRSRTAQAEARASLEMELRASDRLLGVGAEDLDAQAAGPTLTDASVVEVKPEFALVVANIGRNAGVKVGMPFQVWRDNRRVGDVRVIDVRDRLSGAVVQNLVSEEDAIKVGDRLRVDARR
ncbi:MAG: hypothetical protein WEC73_05780 [Chthoniobacterales bacterium]